MSKNQLSILLGKNIVSIRKKRGLTQRALAEKLLISSDAMVCIEKGRNAPKMSRVQEIADILECSVVELFKSDEEIIKEKTNFLVEQMKHLPLETQEALSALFSSQIQLVENTLKKK